MGCPTVLIGDIEANAQAATFMGAAQTGCAFAGV
jgi:hypothetical protein